MIVDPIPPIFRRTHADLQASLPGKDRKRAELLAKKKVVYVNQTYVVTERSEHGADFAVPMFSAQNYVVVHKHYEAPGRGVEALTI